MSVHSGPNIIIDGLVFSVDFANVKNISGITLIDEFDYPITLTNPDPATVAVTGGYADFTPANLTSTAATFYSISNTYFNDIASEISMETTIYPVENLGADQNYVRPISPRTTETNSPLGFGFGTDRISSEIRTTNGWNTTDTITSQITGYNKWYHIAQTTSLSSLTFKTYVNGVLVTNQAFTGTPIGGNGFLIGRGFYAGTANYKGRVGILKVYNKALTADEVKKNFYATKSRFGL